MAKVGTFKVGTTAVAQATPAYELLISLDDVGLSTRWWHDASDKLRGFSINRGRENELDRVDSGTATITLDNRDRQFDPLNTAGPWYPNVTPMNRVWLRTRFAGQT